MARSCIYVVAGPRSCGKSTFIERCKASGASDVLPAALSGLVSAHGPVYYMDLAKLEESGSEALLVHVDLLTPFADLRIPLNGELSRQLLPSAFAEYPGASLFAHCAQLKVLTLRVPRVTTLRRWLGRSIDQGRATVLTTMAQLYSDAHGDSGYAALYGAWDRYVGGLPNAELWNVVEAHDEFGYSIAPGSK